MGSQHLGRKREERPRLPPLLVPSRLQLKEREKKESRVQLKRRKGKDRRLLLKKREKRDNQLLKEREKAMDSHFQLKELKERDSRHLPEGREGRDSHHYPVMVILLWHMMRGGKLPTGTRICCVCVCVCAHARACLYSICLLLGTTWQRCNSTTNPPMMPTPTLHIPMATLTLHTPHILMATLTPHTLIAIPTHHTLMAMTIPLVTNPKVVKRHIMPGSNISRRCMGGVVRCQAGTPQR